MKIRVIDNGYDISIRFDDQFSCCEFWVGDKASDEDKLELATLAGDLLKVCGL